MILEAVAILAPSLVALKIYYSLKRKQLSIAELVMNFGLFVVCINLFIYLIVLYLFGVPDLIFTDKNFIRYTALGTLMALIFPFVVNLIETIVSVEVKANAQKK